MSFNWIFTMIVGAFILFLAIYATTKFLKTGQETIYTEDAAKFVSILEGLETGAASQIIHPINFNKNTKMYFECYNEDVFGRESISLEEQSVGKKVRGQEVNVVNKYIFAENSVEGEKFYVFSKPFTMPFKVADSLIVFAEKYCFYKAPESIKVEVDNENIQFSENLNECNGIKVCFDSSSSECDIKVFRNEKKVVKNGKSMYYEGDLVYSAIFSSPEIYECNVKRLMKRLSELSSLYITKANILQKNNCGLQIEGELSLIKNKARAVTSSSQLSNLLDSANRIETANRGLNTGCRLY